MNIKRIIIIILVVAVASAAYYFFWVKKHVPLEWTTAEVERGDVVVSISSTGTINPVTTVQVGTRVSGTITKIYADFNSNVKKGQVIAELDKTPLLASLQDAQATKQKAYVQMVQAKRDYDRNKKLWDEKIVSDADYYTSQTNYEAAANTYNSSQAQVNNAEINLKYATIIAPINGTVISRNVDVGQTVAASFSTPTLFTIANDLTKMEVQASVDEADIGQVKNGQEVSFTVDAYPDLTFKGTVQQIRIQPIITTNVVTYNVIIEVNNSDLKLLPGMTANITIIVHKHDNVLKVPTAALRFRPDSTIFKEIAKYIPDSVKKKFEERRKEKGGKWGGKGRGGNMHRSYSPGSKATLWMKNGDTILPARIEVGLSDGSYTEVEGKKIKEGNLVILNVKNPEKQKSSQPQQSPFMPGPRGGGGGRRGY